MRIKTGLLLLSLTSLIASQTHAETNKPQQVTGKIFADNSFILFVNGKKVASDPIKFTPHNTVKVKFKTTYPVVYAIEAKDYAHPETGLEYKHTRIGDGGLIVKFSDGTTSNASWKCKAFSQGPTDRACLRNLPKLNCFVKNTPIPKNWMAVNFDDTDWNETREFSDAQVRPHGDFSKNNWTGAKFIWSKDLEIDNTVLCRLTVKKPKVAEKIIKSKEKTQLKERVKISKTKQLVKKENNACKEKSLPFSKFSKHVKTHCDDKFLYIESDGMADHSMMIGIAAWNQQVPKPQPYKGTNAWRIPLDAIASDKTTPNPADGPIAVAINGVPIFDPSKQDGRHDEEHDPNIIGELDICGGHAGRGDDYHYHTAPKCLINSLKNTKQPIAYALDGYPLYGFLDANEQKFVKLDECNGRKTKEGGYQYHSTEDFPYINACFKGLVDLRHRPRTENIRMHGLPIRANIYDYEQLSKNSYRLSYRYKGKNIQINYKKYDEDCYLFHFSDDNRREIYCANKPEKTKKAALTPPPPPKKTNFKKTDKAVVSYISKAAKTLEINEQKLRDSMGKPPYDYKRISERLKVDEGLLHDALGIKRPRHLRKNKR